MSYFAVSSLCLVFQKRVPENHWGQSLYHLSPGENIAPASFQATDRCSKYIIFMLVYTQPTRPKASLVTIKLGNLPFALVPSFNNFCSLYSRPFMVSHFKSLLEITNMHVVYACNSSYSGGQGGTASLRPAWGISMKAYLLYLKVHLGVTGVNSHYETCIAS